MQSQQSMSVKNKLGKGFTIHKYTATRWKINNTILSYPLLPENFAILLKRSGKFLLGRKSCLWYRYQNKQFQHRTRKLKFYTTQKTLRLLYADLIVYLSQKTCLHFLFDLFLALQQKNIYISFSSLINLHCIL